MTVVILVAVALLIILVISLYRDIGARFEDLTYRLSRIEDALGVEKWLEASGDSSGTHQEELERSGVVGRLARIEAALDPMERARQDVKRRMRRMDELLKEDAGSGYEHWQVTKIEDLIEKGERPNREDWESWIGTPFPWNQIKT